MIKKRPLIWLMMIILIAGIFFLAFWFSGDKDQLRLEPGRIAACPTFLKFLELAVADGGNIVSVPNTATALSLLDGRQVDYVLSGRPLKPTERQYQQIFISRSGYSFLGSEEGTFYIDELKNYEIYTDLDSELIKSDLSLDNLIFIEDIYSRPEPSLAITSWDNTDYGRAEIVHVLNRDNSRHPLSRTPVLYCEICGQEIINSFKNIIN